MKLVKLSIAVTSDTKLCLLGGIIETLLIEMPIRCVVIDGVHNAFRVGSDPP